MLRSLTLCLTLVCSFALFAQHPFLSEFRATSSDEGVYLQWTISAGNTCNGTQIQRVNELGEFEDIGSIEGICGSVSEPEDFEYLDLAPMRGMENTYRLVLGVSGPSQTVSIIHYSFGGETFLLLPSSGGSAIHIIPKQGRGGSPIAHIYDMKGSEIASFDVSSSDNTMFSILELSSGSYVLQIEEEGTKVFSARFNRPN